MSTRKSGGKSPRQIVREFAEDNGICTRCTCRWALSTSKLCARCFNYMINAPKSLATAISRENTL